MASSMRSLQNETTARLSARTTEGCKEQILCVGSLATLSGESTMVGKVQTLPTAQHELLHILAFLSV